MAFLRWALDDCAWGRCFARAHSHGVMSESTCCHAVIWTPAEGQQGDKKRTTGGQEEDNQRTREDKEQKEDEHKSGDWLAAVAKLASARGQQEDKKMSRTGKEEDNRTTRRGQEQNNRTARRRQNEEKRKETEQREDCRSRPDAQPSCTPREGDEHS